MALCGFTREALLWEAADCRDNFSNNSTFGRQRVQNWPLVLETLRSSQVRRRPKFGFNWSLTYAHTFPPALSPVSPIYPLQLSIQRDRRWTCDVILRRVRATIVAMERQKYHIFWVCVFISSYTACNAIAHLWSVWLYISFPHYLKNGTNFEKKKIFLEHKNCFVIFSSISVWNISHCKKWQRYDRKFVLVFMCSIRYSC